MHFDHLECPLSLKCQRRSARGGKTGAQLIQIHLKKNELNYAKTTTLPVYGTCHNYVSTQCPILTDTGMGVRDKQLWVFEEFNNLTEIDIGHYTAT